MPKLNEIHVFPPKPCTHCGRPMYRKRQRNGRWESRHDWEARKYCDPNCTAAAFQQLKVPDDEASWYAAHSRARRLKPPGPCERCGKEAALVVHHTDENWRNNDPDNLERLCQSCHLKEHRGRHPCLICGKPVKGHGYCSKHYQRWKKYGDPAMVNTNGWTQPNRDAV
jgi:ssDNA-binding Zn-finger/Zn-ribbon topoisomerase 1